MHTNKFVTFLENSKSEEISYDSMLMLPKLIAAVSFLAKLCMK